MLFSGANILRTHLKYPVCIDQKFDFDSGKPRGRWRNFQGKPRERPAIFRKFTFALQNVNVDPGLVVDTCGVEFLRACRNRRIARNDFRDRAAVGFDAERKRRHIEKQRVADTVFENVGLYGRAKRDNFVGVQFCMRSAAEKLLHSAANQRRACGAAHENDFVDFSGLEFGIAKRQLYGRNGAIDDRAD